LKIAIVCSYYPWPPSVGGVETIARQVSVELAKKGHEVHVVTTPFNAITLKQVSEYGIEEKDRTIVHKLKRSKLGVGYAHFMKGLDGVIEAIDPDIVHSNNLHPHLFQLAKRKAKAKYKLLAELHYPIINIESFSAKIALPLALKYLARINRNIDSFIAHTVLEFKWLIKNGISSDKVQKLMFPCVSSSLINYPTGTNVRKSDDLIFVGRVVRVKGLHILIKALDHLNRTAEGVNLTIVGPCNEGYLKHLKGLIDELKLGQYVSIRGIVSEDEKYRLIMAHKVLVLPSTGEYTPSVILEAQALGKPVIASRIGAVPEMMLDGETGFLVEPSDTMELSKAITALLFNDDLREKMSVKAKEFSRKFLLEVTIRKLEDLYYSLLSD
jgi:glycosyltransferase involved in cell wall biosynthesis